MRSCVLVVACLFGLAMMGIAYGLPVTITSVITPPYPPHLSDYTSQPNKLLVTVQSAPGSPVYRVKFAARIIGVDNPILIFTDPAYLPTQPLILQPGIPRLITVGDLNQFMSSDHLVFQNVTKQQVVRGDGLPEGIYRICVRAYNYDTGEPLSDPEPVGCTGPFPVKSVEPPVFITPLSGANLTPATPQALTLSWTLPAGAPPLAEYTLKLVELIPKSRDPFDALNSATQPPFFESKTTATSLFFGPAQPQLKVGSRYAARVTVRDPQNKIYFKNKGQSQVIAFDYGTLQAGRQYQPPQKEPKAGKKAAKFFAVSMIKGKLNSTFAASNIYGILGRARPLANTPLKLVLYYVFYQPGTKTVTRMEDRELGGHFPGAGQTLATAVTDAQGNFQFSFVPPDSMGLIAADTTVSFSNKEQTYGYQGDLYRVARVLVESPYYTSPDNDVAVAPLQFLDLGALFAFARDYRLTVTMMPSTWRKDAQVTQGPLSGVVVYLLRKNRPTGVPDNEGDQPDPPMTKEGMQVVGVDTTDNSGRAEFRHLVKNISPNDKYYIWAESDPRGEKAYISFKSSFAWGLKSQPPPGSAIYQPLDYYTFNSSYKDLATQTTKSMHPLQPEITGFVYRADSPNTPLGNAKVTLLDYALIWLKETATLTDSATGRFTFGALKLQYDSLDRPAGPFRALRISHAGFRDTTFLVPPASANGEMVSLRLGQRSFFSKLLLQPDAVVSGTVVDEGGAGVNAKVIFPGGNVLDAVSTHMILPGFKWAPAAFSGAAASGKGQRVIIDPYDGAYFTETTYVDIAKGGQTLAPFKVYRREHRIRVVVTTAPRTGPAQPIKDARVTVEGVATKLTSSAGIAEFRFNAAADSFQITARSPEGGDYITKVRNVKAPLAKTFKVVPCSLRLGVHVSGHVYAGQSPVESARVWLADAGSPGVQAYTGGDGAYYIAGVPRYMAAKFRAAKSKSNFIGDSAVISTADSKAGVDFHLTVYDDMDITQLLGFPIEVATLVPVSGGARISGDFAYLPPNPQFRTQDSLAVLAFDSVVIIPSSDKNPKGVPFAKPKSGFVTTAVNNLAARVNSLAGTVEDKTAGIRVAPFAAGGAVRGNVFLSGASYLDPGLSLAGVWLVHPDSGIPSLPTVTSSGTVPFPGTPAFPARPQSGKTINYGLHGFAVTADTAGSHLAGTTLTLAGSVLHTAFTNIAPADAKIAVGAVAIQPDKVLPLTGGPPIAVPIEKWTLQGDTWSLTSAGLILNKGKIKTGVVDVPFTAVEIKPSGPTYGSYQLTGISIGGIIPLNVTGKTVFGWDPGKGHWALSVVPDTGSTAAWFGGLPGMATGDRVRVNNFFLLSSGDAEFTPLSKPITLYKVASFTPTAITAYSTYVHIPGIIDVGVPLVAASPAAIDYSNPGGVMKFGLQSFPIKFATKGVVAEFSGDPAHPQTLDEKGFVARGRVSEPNLWGLEVTLFRTVESTATWVIPKESLYVDPAGQRKLRNVVGNMRVASGEWSNFTFSGDLVGANGATSYLTFVVKGEVEASGQQVEVKNIPSPFGGINLTYDFVNHRLMGSLHYDRTLQGGTEVKTSGDAEVLVDGDGWYFLAAGTMKLPKEGKEGQAAMIIGSYPMNSHIKSVFQQYSFVYQEYGSLPAIFPSEVAGFYFEAMAAMPIPIIPSGEFDFGLISGVLKHQVGADMRLSMQFSQGATFGIGQSAFAKVWVGLGGSVVVVCAGVSAEIKEVISWDGQYSTSGNWFVDGDGHLVLSGSTYIGTGLCDSNCESVLEVGGFGTPCFKHEEGGSVKLGVHGHYGSDYKKLEFYWE